MAEELKIAAALISRVFERNGSLCALVECTAPECGVRWVQENFQTVNYVKCPNCGAWIKVG